MAFADFPYGNTPLDLPSGWEAEALPDGRDSDRELASLEDHDDGASVDGAGEEAPLAWHDWQEYEPSADRLFWFRWITGHQVSFLCWRAAGMSLMASSSGPAASEQELRRAAAMLRAASAMFVYTASCPRELYHALIRPRMSLWHSAFTGRWAADYRPLPQLISRLQAVKSQPAAADVRKAFRESQQVHVAAAQKLVPDARSVLQEFVRRNAGAPSIDPAITTFIYDSFFLVRRTRVSPAEMAASLRARIAVVSADLHCNGLYPASASSEGEAPIGAHGARFESYAQELPLYLSTQLAR